MAEVTTSTNGATENAVCATYTVSDNKDTGSGATYIDPAEYARVKSALDKATSEAAEFKKALRAKQTDAENAAADQQARWNEMQAQLDALKEQNAQLTQEREKAAAKANFLGLPGFNDKIADAAAGALVGGDSKKLFEELKKAFEAHAQNMTAENMKNMPAPGGAGGNGTNNEADKWAERFGKERASAKESANNILKHYVKGG